MDLDFIISWTRDTGTKKNIAIKHLSNYNGYLFQQGNTLPVLKDDREFMRLNSSAWGRSITGVIYINRSTTNVHQFQVKWIIDSMRPSLIITCEYA